MDVRARSCSLFSSFKKGKAFSLRCLSPLCSPAVGAGQAYPLRGGMLRCGLAVLQRQVMRVSVPAQSAVGRLTHCRAGWFIMLDCFAAQSNEGFCSLAVGVGHTQPLQGFCFRRSGWRSDLPLAGDFGIPSASGFGGASREACRRAAVASRSSCMSPERPARLWRAVRGAGGHPLPVYWLRGWRAMVSSMICLRSSSLMPARISLMESIRGLPLARPTAIVVSPSATVKPSPSSKDR